MGRLIYDAVDTAVAILCLPAYAVLFVLMRLHAWAVVRFRRVTLGLEVNHSPMLDQREDLLVADISRLPDGKVGVRRREWNELGHARSGLPPPPYGEAVEYWTAADFWLGRRGPSRSEFSRPTWARAARWTSRAAGGSARSST